VHLVRDVLDKQVVDRNGREMGRVDRVVIERRDGAPPRVVAIEIGATALAARLGPAVGRWVTGMLHGLGVVEGQPLRVPLRQILGITNQIAVDYAFGETAAANLERKLRGVIRRWSGGRR
jgi:hypothetical protein